MSSDDRHDGPFDAPTARSRAGGDSGATGDDAAWGALGGPGEEAFVRELLGVLDSDRPPAPEALPERTIRKIRAELTGRDLIDLTTFVFLMRFCAPLLDLLAAFFGHDPLSPPESMSAPRATRSTDPRRDRDE